MKKKNYICPRCNRIFKNNYTLTRHINRKKPCDIIDNIIKKIPENLNIKDDYSKIPENLNTKDDYSKSIYKKIQKNKNIWYKLNQIKID